MTSLKFLRVAKLVLIYGLFILSSLSCACRKQVSETIEKNGSLTFVDNHGQLKVSGTRLVDQQGKTIALKGVSLGWHNWWPRFYNQKTINWLNEDWNCQLVRAAIGVGVDNDYIHNPAFALERLYVVVDAAISNGMYVIIDWHSHHIQLAEAKEFFQTVASKYKDYPNIIYEIYNEPIDDSWSEVKVYAEEVIRAIRAIDKKNIILVGSPNWDQDIHLVADDPILGFENIMYTVHFYAATHAQWLRDRADYALQKGIPVFVSECAAVEADGNGPINHTEWNTWINWMKQHQISWVAWSIADKDESCSMLKDHTVPVDQWTQEELKEWANMVRPQLRTLNQ